MKGVFTGTEQFYWWLVSGGAHGLLEVNTCLLISYRTSADTEAKLSFSYKRGNRTDSCSSSAEDWILEQLLPRKSKMCGCNDLMVLHGVEDLMDLNITVLQDQNSKTVS